MYVHIYIFIHIYQSSPCVLAIYIKMYPSSKGFLIDREKERFQREAQIMTNPSVIVYPHTSVSTRGS